MNWTSSTMRMAWRNLWRNPRRTVLALSAIGLSVMLVLAYTSILRAVNGSSRPSPARCWATSRRMRHSGGRTD